MLSARSQVFHAMFNSDMVENKSGSVNVEDFHPNVMKEMLQYIYTGTKNKLLYENWVHIINWVLTNNAILLSFY